MTIPATITLTEEELNINNASFNTDGTISVTDSTVEIDVVIPGGLVSQVEVSLVNELTPIDVESTSTSSQLVLTEANYNIATQLKSIALLENNTLSVLQENTDFKLAATETSSVINNYFNLPYNSAYNSGCLYNGMVYVFGGYNGTAGIDTIYQADYDSTTGLVSNWSISPITLPAATHRYTLVQNGNFVYILGGAGSSAVYYTSINSDGSLNAFTTSSYDLPATGTLQAPMSFIYNGFIYIFDIYNGASTTNIIYYAPVNTNGSLGAWVTQTLTTSIPNTTNCGIAQNGGYYYIVGGGNSAVYSLTNTYYGVINSDGSLGEPIAGTPLPISLNCPNLVCYGGMLFVLNSATSSGVAANNIIYVAPINSSGGINGWISIRNINNFPATYNAYIFDPTAGNFLSLSGVLMDSSPSTFVNSVKVLNFNNSLIDFISTISFAEGILVGNYYYVLGGENGGVLNTVFYAEYDATTKTLSNWAMTTPLPTTLVSFALCENNGYIYVISGATNGTNFGIDGSTDYIATTYYAAINSGGSLGGWVTSNQTLPISLAEGTALVNNNVIYLIGSYASPSGTYNSYYSILTTTGELGPWNTQSGTLSTSTQTGGSPSICAFGNYYYVVGGGYSNGYSLNAVTLLTLDTTTNQFTATTQTALPVALRRPNAFVYNSTLYVQDGGNPDTGFINNDVYSAPINTDGTIGSWSTTSNPLFGLYGNVFTYDATNNLTINIGGIQNFNGSALGSNYEGGIYLSDVSVYSNTDTVVTSDYYITNVPTFSLLSSNATGYNFEETQIVYYNEFIYLFVTYNEIVYILNTSTNVWTTSPFPTTLYIPSILAYNDIMYIFGGIVGGSGTVNTIYSAPINSDGSLGTFTKSSSSLPSPVLTPNNTYINNNYAYIFGGISCNSSSCSFSPSVYQCPLSDATLTTWITYNSILGALGTNIIAAGSIVINNYCVIGNDSVVLFIYPISSTSTGILSAPVDSAGNISDFVLVTPNIPILGQVQYALSLANGNFIINTLYNGSVYTYLGSLDDMTGFSLIGVSASINYGSPLVLYINNVLYSYKTTNIYKVIFNSAGGVSTYSVNLNNTLNAVPTSIYIPNNLNGYIQWNSWGKQYPLTVDSVAVSSNQITYTFSTMENPNLVLETNYPKFYLSTNSYSSQLNSLVFNTTSLPT